MSLLKMENPFELILERLERIEIAIEKLNAPPKNEDEILLTRLETAKLLKINGYSLNNIFIIFAL